MTITTEPRERPILMSGPMVQAILDGRKTQTRRVVKPPCGTDWYDELGGKEKGFIAETDGPGWWHIEEIECPYGVVGGRLWVRESFAYHAKELASGGRSKRIAYMADGQCVGCGGDGNGGWMQIHHGWVTGIADLEQRGQWVGRSLYGPFRPSIHMPRWACRLVIEITDVRVERLQVITPEDCFAEGLSDPDGKIGWSPSSAPADFAATWDVLNAKRGFSWQSNPWVWAISFRRLPC